MIILNIFMSNNCFGTKVNIMFFFVTGESGLGKSTLVSSLFMNNDLYKDRTIPTIDGKN